MVLYGSECHVSSKFDGTQFFKVVLMKLMGNTGLSKIKYQLLAKIWTPMIYKGRKPYELYVSKRI